MGPSPRRPVATHPVLRCPAPASSTGDPPHSRMPMATRIMPTDTVVANTNVAKPESAEGNIPRLVGVVASCSSNSLPIPLPKLEEASSTKGAASSTASTGNARGPTGVPAVASSIEEAEASSRAAPPSLVFERLLVGSYNNARAATHLRQLGVDAVLCCAVELPREACGGVRQYLHIPLHDSPFADARAEFPNAIQFLDECQRQHRTVLVHCVHGLSRSPTLVCAWLMRSQGWTLQQAIHRLWSVRERVRPNHGFQRQLMAFDRELYGQNSFNFDASQAPGVKTCEVCNKQFLPRGFPIHQRSCQAKRP
eukprot:jgi/Mesvir1/26788/Mv20556-RA.1